MIAHDSRLSFHDLHEDGDDDERAIESRLVMYDVRASSFKSLRDFRWWKW